MMDNAFWHIGVDPVLVKFGPFSVGWYGLMVALAVITVVGWIAWQAMKTRTISSDVVFTGALVGIPSGIVFSKVLHVIDQWSYYVDHPGQIFSGQGLTIWGAVLGAALGVWVYGRISRGFRYAQLADIAAPGIILAQAIGRVGCTFNGCCYGLESHGVCTVVYTNPNSYGPVGIPVLPTHIFEIGFDLALFGILMAFKGKLKPAGSLFAVYFAFYGAWRFGIEFIRDGAPFIRDGVPILSMHEAQLIGLIVMLVAIPFIIWRTRWANKTDMAIEAVNQQAERPSEGS